jgi:hypothetical protein
MTGPAASRSSNPAVFRGAPALAVLPGMSGGIYHNREPPIDNPRNAGDGIVGPMRGSVAAVSCWLGLLLGACAIANTPAQIVAYERWAKCSSPYVQLQWVGVDGRIAFMFSNPAAREEILECLADAGRGGPPLPAPVAVRPPGGP